MKVQPKDKEAVEKNDLELIKTKTQELTQSSMKMGEAMYKDQQANGAPGAESGDQPQPDDKADAPKEDDVIDADFEEVDDDKKASGQ